MKKTVLYGLFAAIVFFSCRKEDNPRIPDLTRLPVPYIAKDAGSDQFINPANPLLFTAKFTVDRFFASDVSPQKFDVVAIKNGIASGVKTIKADIATFPTSVNVTGQQLTDLFGTIKDGDQFTFGVDITTADGYKFQAFPEVGVQFAGGTAAMFNEKGLAASTSINYVKPCGFVADDFVGNYTVVQDDWQDYTPGTVISVAKESTTEISFKYNQDFMQTGTAQPIIMKVNTSDNSVSVVKQQYGIYLPADVFFAESVAGNAANFVNPCNKTISIRLRHTTTGYSSDRTVVLRKK